MPGARINFRQAAGSGSRSRLVLLGMLVLLGAGCDYWDNLTDPKIVDKGGLGVVVLDAWTGDSLQFATCGDSSGSWSQRADGAGRIARPDMPTGTHTILCKCTGYFDRISKVDVKPGNAGAVKVTMARMGGDYWYPEDNRRVSIRMLDGNFRFPGKMLLQAYPVDSAGIFQYEWTSSLHSNLAGFTESALPLFTPLQSAETVEVTVSLRIRATLNATTYEVGTDSQVFILNRNQLPTILLQGNFQDSIKVGCKIDPYLNFGLNTWDPDGVCQSVTLISTDPTSSLGLINETRSCGQGQSVAFPIKAHASGIGVPLTRENYLIVRVADDNDQYKDDTVHFTTFSSQPPNISLEQVDATDKNLPNAPLKFHVQSGGGNSGFDTLLIDWKDGQIQAIPLAAKRIEGSFSDSIEHAFTRVGTYAVEASMIDKCNNRSTAVLTVPVVENRLPKIGQLDPRGFQPSSNEYHLYVEASDEDVGAGLDSLRVQVIWGDGQGDQYQAAKYQSIRRLFTHRYPADWAEPSFRIEVTVSDAHDGNVFDSAMVAKPTAAFPMTDLPPAYATPPDWPSTSLGLDRPGAGSQGP